MNFLRLLYAQMSDKQKIDVHDLKIWI